MSDSEDDLDGAVRQPTEVGGVELPDAPTEAATDRDGLLSYASEWHALVIGFVVGLVSALTGWWGLLVVVVSAALGATAVSRHGSTRVPAFGEIRREPWYALGGVLLGVVVFSI